MAEDFSSDAPGSEKAASADPRASGAQDAAGTGQLLDLTPFCSTEETRPYLHKPFSRGDWTYATDGSILVRVPRRGDAPDADHIPSIEAVLAANVASEFRPLRHAPMPPSEKYKVECDVCGGRGHLHDCPDCTCECEECDSTGELEAVERLSAEISGAPVQAKYVRLLQSLPDLEVSTAGKADTPLYFRFRGGDGLVMPLRYARETHITEPES